MPADRKRFPLNVPGDFYVEDGLCMACEAPEAEATDLMSHEAGSGHCYFRRQPATAEEIGRAVMAVVVSCCAAVRYGGGSPDVIRRLTELGAAGQCDQR